MKVDVGDTVATTNASLARGEDSLILKDLEDGYYEVRPITWLRGSIDLAEYQIRWVVKT